MPAPCSKEAWWWDQFVAGGHMHCGHRFVPEMLSASTLACCFPISSCWHTRASLSWGRLHKPHWGPPQQINSLSIFLLAAGEVCSSDVIRGDSRAGLGLEQPPDTSGGAERKISPHSPAQDSDRFGVKPFLVDLSPAISR